MVQYNPSLCRDQLVLTEVAQRVDWPSDIAENLCAYLSCGKMCVEFKGEYINGGYCDKNRAFCGLNTTEKFSYGKNPDYEEEDRVSNTRRMRMEFTGVVKAISGKRNSW